MSAAPAWNSDEYWSLFSLSTLAEAGIDAYLQQVASSTAGIFEASGSSIFLSDASPTVFRVRARAGRQSTVPHDARIIRGQGVAGHVVATGSARILGDLAADTELHGLASHKHSDVSSSMVLPLFEPDGDVIGVLNLSRHIGMPPFQSEDLERARAVASNVALAASNARLMESLRGQIFEVQQSGEKLQAVFDSVGSALLVYNETGSIIDSNFAAQVYVTDETKSWIGSEAMSPALKKAIDQIHEKREAVTVRAEDSETKKIWHVHGTPIASGGMVVTVTDITEHEAALKEADRLRRMAEIGQMTATIAHEIRNPLTGIRSAAQVVREAPEHSDEFLGVIEEEVLKLNELCEQFLAFAKPLQLSLEPVQLITLVESVCELQKTEFEQEGVKLTVEIGSDQPKMNLDSRRIEQVVHNLLRNARQACETNGEVVVRLERNELVVEDDGIGMTEEQIEMLFTPFFTTKHDGTGLGLSNVRRILDAHEVTVKVQSELGKGSRFTIDFERSHI